jgi:hypothetical protein
MNAHFVIPKTGMQSINPFWDARLRSHGIQQLPRARQLRAPEPDVSIVLYQSKETPWHARLHEAQLGAGSNDGHNR